MSLPATPPVCAALLLAVSCGHVYAATEMASVRCGGGEFQIKTQTASATHGTLWVGQALSLNGAPLTLPDAPSADTKTPLGAAITGWRCVAGAHTPILVLAYSCASDEMTACDGHQEWMRLFDPEGHRLDSGFKPADDRLPGLLNSLGLSAQARAGIQMQNVMP